jgi:hypothetical protein
MTLAPTSSRGASGFVPARNVGQASFAVTDAAVASSATTVVEWVFGQGQESLINVATPTNPKPVTAGVYAIQVWGQYVPTDTSASRRALMELRFDDDWYSGTLYQSIDYLNEGGVAFGGNASLAVTWYSDALSPFFLALNTLGADTAGAFSYNAYVERIT